MGQYFDIFQARHLSHKNCASFTNDVCASNSRHHPVFIEQVSYIIMTLVRHNLQLYTIPVSKNTSGRLYGCTFSENQAGSLIRPIARPLSEHPKENTEQICSSLHTSYLSGAPGAVPVEKKLSCAEICPHDRLSGG